MDKETLRQMIEEQQQAVKKAQEQLQKLCVLATEMGIEVETLYAGGSIAGEVRHEIERRRQEIMVKVEKVRKEAMEQAQQTMSEVKSVQGMPMASPMASAMPFGGGGMMPSQFDFSSFIGKGDDNEKRKP